MEPRRESIRRLPVADGRWRNVEQFGGGRSAAQRYDDIRDGHWAKIFKHFERVKAQCDFWA